MGCSHLPLQELSRFAVCNWITLGLSLLNLPSWRIDIFAVNGVAFVVGVTPCLVSLLDVWLALLLQVLRLFEQNRLDSCFPLHFCLALAEQV